MQLNAKVSRAKGVPPAINSFFNNWDSIVSVMGHNTAKAFQKQHNHDYRGSPVLVARSQALESR
jgi:hypothetical protein